MKFVSKNLASRYNYRYRIICETSIQELKFMFFYLQQVTFIVIESH